MQEARQLSLFGDERQEARQLGLFGDERQEARKTKRKGGSQNPIVFRDYDSFIRKFTENPRTTDECYTPRDVYDAVLRYVGEIHDLAGKEILRPFYPGGDYANAEYPANGVVVDNPPFSAFTKIVRFYCARGIPFFLFGPGMTIGSVCRFCTAVIVPECITFSNKAKVRCNFATNLMGDTLVTTAVRLGEYLRQCPSQDDRVRLPKYAYPDELLSVSDFQAMAKGREDFSISRSEAEVVKKLDNHPTRYLFGDHFLTSPEAARKAAARKAAARKAAAREAAAREAAAREAIPIELSARERHLSEELGKGSIVGFN